MPLGAVRAGRRGRNRPAGAGTRSLSRANLRGARSNGEALTPFFPPCGDDPASILGRHPRQETVDALPSPVMRLKRALHSTGTPDTKMAVMGGSALVYAPRRGAVKPTHSSRESWKGALRILLTFSTRVEKVVENGRPRCAANAHLTPIPAAVPTLFKAAKKSRKP